MIVIDIEASSLDPERGSIISLGAIDFKNPARQFYEECRVWDGAHIAEESLTVNGFSKEEITDPSKKDESETIRAFVAWAQEMDDWTFAGQNVSFDRDYVEAACHRAGIEFPFAHRTIDTHTLAYMHMVKRGILPPFDPARHRTALNLDAVLSYCGIPEEPKPHNALTGAMCHAEVTSRLLYDEQLLPEFDVFPIPWKQKAS